PEESRRDLDGALEAAVGVPLVVTAAQSELQQRRDLLAGGVADQIRSRVREGMTLGVSWSRTIEAAARHLDSLPPCEVVQLVGAQPVEGSGNSLELIQQFNGLPGGATVRTCPPRLPSDPGPAPGV